MAFARFFASRMLQAVPVLLGVTLVVFVLIHLVPGDPAQTALGPRATPDAIDALHGQWGLDQPLHEQYLLFMERLFGGDLGTSLRFGQPAGDLIAARLPVTLWLIVYAAVLACLFAVPLALWAASRPAALRDRVVRVISVVGLGVPGFWLGLVLIEVVSVNWLLLPAAGVEPGFLGHVESLFLPSLTIAAGMTPLVVRSLRTEVLRVTESDFVTTARAKGLTQHQIRMRHLLRNALAPSVTVLTVNVSFLIGGTLVIERVFGLGGLGDLMLTGIDARDFPLVQAVTLVLAVLVVIVNILGDLAQALIDPRVEVQ
jgi:ABC-type dipeptide/oligopeptide/nickel transport system permease component